MDKAISSENAYKFIKELVELGGIRYVDQDHMIRNTSDDSPVGVKTGIPPKNRPVAIFHEGMEVGDYVALNPFSDVLGNSPERAMFTNWMLAFPGSLIRHVVMRMIEVGISKEKDAGYKANKFVSKWGDKYDDKLLEEAERIPGTDWAKIFYDRTKRIAQLQSNIGYDELKNRMRSKVRKSSWPVFVDMLKTILQLSNNKKPESLYYESKSVSIPKMDAILNLLIDVLDKMREPITLFTDVEIPYDELKEHISHIDAYREATKWFASATVSNDSEIQPDDNSAPWAVPSTLKPLQAEMPGSSPMEEAMTIAKLQPAGVIVNDSYSGCGFAGAGLFPTGSFCGGQQPMFANNPNNASSEIMQLRTW